MSNLSKHLLAAVIAIAFAVMLYLDSYKLNFAGYLLPRILSATIILLSLAMIAEAWWCQKKSGTADCSSTETNSKRVIIFISSIIAYIVGINIVGYFVSTPLYIVGAYLYLNAMKLRNSILIAVGFTVFVYLLFVAFLQLPIPLGPME
jgi:membrane-bound metal-dependent hydrolase YbcI (DUF457 family)